MLALARRAGTLTLAEWAILAESVVLAVGIELALRLMPFSRVLRFVRSGGSSDPLTNGGSRTARSGGSSDPPIANGSPTELYSQLARFTAAAYRVLPVPSTCLRESLVLCALLNRRGARARLGLGVNKNGAALAAHAWVECEGVASEEGRSSFRELRTN